MIDKLHKKNDEEEDMRRMRQDEKVEIYFKYSQTGGVSQFTLIWIGARICAAYLIILSGRKVLRIFAREL